MVTSLRTLKKEEEEEEEEEQQQQRQHYKSETESFLMSGHTEGLHLETSI